MVVLALNERGGLAHVLLFWGALGRQKEGLRIKLVSSPLFNLFVSSQKVGGQEKNLDKPNLRAIIKPADLGALVSSWFMGSSDNSTRALFLWEPWRHVSVRV